jgi:hypothetical protein
MALLLLVGFIVFQIDAMGLKTAVVAACGHFGNIGLVGIMMAAPIVVAPFPVDPELTAQSVAYRNESLIQDFIAPRVPVGVQVFKYRKYALADGFTVPDTKVGRKGEPNTVEFGFTEETSACEDFGLDDVIPNDDIKNAPTGYDPVSKANLSLTDLILLAREVRVANAAFNADNYAAANKQTLSGTSQISDFTNSDPINLFLEALDTMVMRGNICVMGQPVWTKLRQHPKVVSAVLGNSGTSGVITKEQLAEKLEVNKVYVGSGWVNTAKKGQSPTMVRVWGKHLAFHYQDTMATTQDRVTYMYTAQFGDRVAGQIAEPKTGLRGAVRVRAGESVKEVVSATDLGYLFVNAVE